MKIDPEIVAWFIILAICVASFFTFSGCVPGDGILKSIAY